LSFPRTIWISFILLINFNVYLRYKELLVAQRQAIIAVKCAEEESVRLTSEMAEAKRINHIMDKKYRTFVDVLDKLNHINQGPLIMACVAFWIISYILCVFDLKCSSLLLQYMWLAFKELLVLRSESDVEQRALIFWFNSSRGLQRAWLLLRTAVKISKNIQVLKHKVMSSDRRRVLSITFHRWHLLLKLGKFRNRIFVQVSASILNKYQCFDSLHICVRCVSFFMFKTCVAKQSTVEELCAAMEASNRAQHKLPTCGQTDQIENRTQTLGSMLG
jgi:hypothetical protein